MVLQINISEQHKNDLEFSLSIKGKDKPITVGTKLLVKKRIVYMYSDNSEVGKFIVVVKGISIQEDYLQIQRLFIRTQIQEIVEIKVKNGDDSQMKVGSHLSILPKDIIEILD